MLYEGQMVPTFDIAVCPCCGQKVWLRKHPITWTMAVGLCCLHIYFKHPDAAQFVHGTELRVKVPAFAKVVHSGGEFAQLAHWGFIERMPGEKLDGNPHNGFWRITDSGQGFVLGARAYRFVYTYNRTLYGFSDGVTKAPDGSVFPYETTDISGAFGTPFSYDNSLTGVWNPPLKPSGRKK